LLFDGAAGPGKGENWGSAEFYRAHRLIFAGDPLKKAQNKRHSVVFQLSRRPGAEHLPQYETDVECADMDQQTLQNVVMPAQGRAPHPTRLVTVGKAAFHQFTAALQQPLAVVVRCDAP
jgi:hypothetical protein